MSGFMDSVGGAVDSFFQAGDTVLNMGGQSILDAAGVATAVCEPIPYLGEAAEGANLLLNEGQAAYHGAHAINDLRHGNNREAMAQGAETVYHAALPALGPSGGAVEAGAFGWDSLAAGLNYLGGDKDTRKGAAFNTEGQAVSAPAVVGNAIADWFGVKDHGHEGGANEHYSE
jgi:hypothetical protein